MSQQTERNTANHGTQSRRDAPESRSPAGFPLVGDGLSVFTKHIATGLVKMCGHGSGENHGTDLEASNAALWLLANTVSDVSGRASTSGRGRDTDPEAIQAALTLVHISGVGACDYRPEVSDEEAVRAAALLVEMSGYGPGPGCGAGDSEVCRAARTLVRKAASSASRRDQPADADIEAAAALVEMGRGFGGRGS